MAKLTIRVADPCKPGAIISRTIKGHKSDDAIVARNGVRWVVKSR